MQISKSFILVMESTFLLILGSFLSIYLTSGCEYDNQCAFGLRCCKQTEAGRVLEEGKCVSRETCSGFCLKTDDCLPPERCNASRYNCTAKCSNDTDCLHGYICENDHCVSNETNDNDVWGLIEALLILLLPFILGGLLYFFYIYWCLGYNRTEWCVEKLQSLFLNLRGRNCSVCSLNGNPPTRTNAPQQNNETLEMNFTQVELYHLRRLYLNGQQNAETLEMDSIRPPVHDSNGESFDTNPSSAPPACIEVRDVPEVSPAPYESIITLVVLPNELQNAEMLETDSSRPPVQDSNDESFHTNPSSTPPSCIEVSDVPRVAPPPYESIHTSVVLPNELQNAETLETESIRPPVYDSNSESFDTNPSSIRPACIDVPEVPPPPYESIITLVVFPNELQNGETLETDSTRPPVLETNGENFDNIASRGLPSYSEIFNVPETPLPTYEEATGDSTGSLNI